MTRVSLWTVTLLLGCACAAAAQVPDSRTDDAAIRKMLADYQAAYNAHDAAKAAAFYAEEGDRRTPDGRVVHGRAAVQEQLAGDFKARFRSAVVNFEDAEDIRHVGETLATVDGASQLSGVSNAEGWLSPGVRYLHTILVTREGGRWRILSMRNWPAPLVDTARDALPPAGSTLPPADRPQSQVVTLFEVSQHHSAGGEYLIAGTGYVAFNGGGSVYAGMNRALDPFVELTIANDRDPLLAKCLALLTPTTLAARAVRISGRGHFEGRPGVDDRRLALVRLDAITGCVPVARR